MIVNMLLKQIRNDRNLSLRDLEQLANVSKSELNNIETGKVIPRLDVALRIANGLGIPITDLYIDTEHEKIKREEQQSKCDTCICYRAFLNRDAMNNELLFARQEDRVTI